MTAENTVLGAAVECSPHERLVAKAPFTIEELFDGEVPTQKLSTESQYPDLGQVYMRYAQSPMRPYAVEGSPRDDFLVVCPPLRGLEVQYAFHYAAPSKLFGVDYRDTQADWRNLYSDKVHAHRLAAHRKIPGWNHIERHRLAIVNHIEDGKEKAPSDFDAIGPVLRFSRDVESGRYEWNLDDLPQDTSEKLTTQLNPTETVLHLPMMGPLITAAYSWGQMKGWAEKLNYAVTNQKSDGQLRLMGSTQVLSVSIALADNLFATPFASRIRERYEVV